MLRLLFVVAFAGLSDGVGILSDDILTVVVGRTATFKTNLNPPEKPFRTISWQFGISPNDKPIIASHTDEETIGPEYEGRITLIRSTGSLELRNLNLSDAGQYAVIILPASGLQMTGQTILEIYEPVSNVSVFPLSADLVEFNNSIRLSCSSSGSSLSFLWMNSSSVVSVSDRVQITNTDGGSDLTIVDVTRYDKGSYTCNVSNPVSFDISDPVNIFVSYGPDNVQIEVDPPKEHHKNGSDIHLICLADSSPSAEYMWSLNGGQLPDTGSELRLLNIQMNHSGNYSCQAFNSKTFRYQTSQPSAIFIHAPVSNVKVTEQSSDLVEFNSSVRLSCSSSGSSLSFLWMNSSSEVSASDRVQITDGGSTLTIINVTRYDDGSYSCHVSNPVSSVNSNPVHLSVSYGPENINLEPPSQTYPEGSDIHLSCSADSRPNATFDWFLNGVSLPGSGSEHKLTKVQKDQSGNYSCRAFNSRTSKYQTSQISVISIVESKPLPPGAIAGLVIGCLACVSLITLGVYFILKKKKSWGKTSNRNISTGGNRRDNGVSSNEELNYADVRFAKNKKNVQPQWELDNPSSTYADIRVNRN